MSTITEINELDYAELLVQSKPRQIRNAADHERFTAMLLELDERENISPEEEALAEVLTLLIEDYEAKYHPMPQVSPTASLNALMEERGGNDPIWGSFVKQTLKRRHPGFSERFHGFRSFGNLLEAARDRGMLEMSRDEKSGDYIIKSVPDDATAAA